MNHKKILITGGLGFLGTYLTNHLLKKNYTIVIFDKLIPAEKTKKVIYFNGNVLSKSDLKEVFTKYGPFNSVYHLAADLPNKSQNSDKLWRTNTLGTINTIEYAIQFKTKSFIFTSSNTIYGIPSSNPVTEKTSENPLENYGKSKAEAEKQLKKYKEKINIQIFRCPVISGEGRLGLQGILYEFISENKNIYLLGNGQNKYQFIDALDLCDALEKASKKNGFEVYNIGADNVLSLKDIYLSVISKAKSKSKIIPLPQKPVTFLLFLLDKLNLSPIGVYQASMLGRSLFADTEKVKNYLNWKPKKTNIQMFIENYNWYIKNKNKLETFNKNKNSANKSLPKMGVLRLIKFFS